MTLLPNIVFSDMIHTASSLSCINRIRVSNSVCCAVDSFVMDNFFFGLSDRNFVSYGCMLKTTLCYYSFVQM